MIHKLKVWPEPFEEIRIGAKPFDVRHAGFEGAPGDVIMFEEWDPNEAGYTGRSLYAQITYQFDTSAAPPAFGLPRGLVVSALRVLGAKP